MSGRSLRRLVQSSPRPRSPAALPASARRERSILNHMNQQQNQHDQHYQAKTTTTVVADSGAHAIASETEHQQQDKQKNDHNAFSQKYVWRAHLLCPDEPSVENQKRRHFYPRLFEVGVTGSGTLREPAEGFSTTSAGSSLRASRTDSVSLGSSISLFTLESVVLALFAGFVFFCIVKCSQG
jgi:hypothetical protein